MEYEIKADAKQYSEWGVDQITGRLKWLEHTFDDYDIMYYKIVDETGDPVQDGIKTFEEAKKALKEWQLNGLNHK